MSELASGDDEHQDAATGHENYLVRRCWRVSLCVMCKIIPLSWLAAIFLLTQVASAQLYLEGIEDDDVFADQKLVGSFTIPDSGRSHGATELAIGSTGYFFYYGKGDRFGRLFHLNSAYVTGGALGPPFRRWEASSVQPLSNVRVVALNPRFPEIDINAFQNTLRGSSLDTVILFQ
jgi:hypothetical protein